MHERGAECQTIDNTGKRMLLEKREPGKKRMRQFGKVEIPQGASIEALRLGDE